MIREPRFVPALELEKRRTTTDSATPSRSEIEYWIEHSTHLLPAQGPIEVFVHHNTLHAFEKHNFHEAVRLGLHRYGAQPYLTETTYRTLYQEGRISDRSIEAVIMQGLSSAAHETINGLGTRAEIRLAMLRHPLHVGPDAELQWIIAETDALDRFRPQVSEVNRGRMVNSAVAYFDANRDALSQTESMQECLGRIGRDSGRWNAMAAESFALRLLWEMCRSNIERHVTDSREGGLGFQTDEDKKQPNKPGWKPSPHSKQENLHVRPRDVLLHATGDDIDRCVEESLIRLTGGFIDQGYAGCELPSRDQGFLSAFKQLYRKNGWTVERWLEPLSQMIIRIEQQEIDALDIVKESLQDLGIDAEDAEEFIAQTLLALGGWAGMVWQLECGVDWVVRLLPKGSLVEFLAVRLILERLAIRDIARTRNIGGSKQTHVPTWQLIRDLTRVQSSTVRHPSYQLRESFLLFQVAQLLGWTAQELAQMNPSQWYELHVELTRFGDLDRRQVYQEAFERDYRHRALDALGLTVQKNRRARTDSKLQTSFQIVTCIDDREESFRRHLEEVDSSCETFGAAGFFAVAIYYRGAGDAFYKPLCPGVITPGHYVQEDVGYSFEGIHQSRAKLRSRLGVASYAFTTQSRNVLGGLLAGVAGSLATAPLIARVLAPRLTSRIRKRFGTFLQPPPVTNLHLERYEEPPGPDETHIGYRVDEMAATVVRLLQDIGAASPDRLSRLFIVCGHGSSSLNNPHESAYCCGACAGKRGGPNARAFAQMANDYRVRERAKQLGVTIPDDTWFVGAYHNTCDDSVVFYDLDRLPASHRNEFDQARDAIEEARARNAHERCRRFGSAALDLSFEEALRHVEGRAEDISQARPEYNHATNALCIVGHRWWSRGLFLDRRAFLTSYDSTTDDENATILKRILAAVVPVCAGINLEYYFSKVDFARYGSGSKLPHNLVGLLGVMEGTSSDLRTGLYRQMTEIHDPLRITFVIEATPETLLSVMDENPTIGGLVRGGWVHVATIDPRSSAVPAENLQAISLGGDHRATTLNLGGDHRATTLNLGGDHRATARMHRFEDGRFIEHQVESDALKTAASSLDCYEGHRDNRPPAWIDSRGVKRRRTPEDHWVAATSIEIGGAR